MRAFLNRALGALLVVTTPAWASNPPGAAGDVLSAPPPSKVAEPAPQGGDGQAELERLSTMKRGASVLPDGDRIRLQAMEEEALGVGTRAGLAWRYARIEEMLHQHEPQLDIVFNFAPLLIDDIGLPPGISEFRDGFRIDGPELASSTAVGYRIEHRARIVAATPNWRQFLIRGFPSPEDPHPAILPKTSAESAVWQDAVRRGWNHGVRQADRIFEANLAVLARTLEGMLTYHRLVRQGMIEPLHVVKTDEGISFTDTSLDVGRIIYRVPSQPAFQPPGRWEPRLQDPIPLQLPRSGAVQ